MNFFATAYADEGAQAAANAAPGPDMTFIVFMALAFVCFYFFVLRPGNKKNKERAGISSFTFSAKFLSSP